MIYTFIDVHCAGLPVDACCRTMKVSRSAFHRWRYLQANPTAKMAADADLGELIVKIHDQSDGTYGVPRLTAELRLGLGRMVNRKRVERLMREHGLQGVTRRRQHGCTRRNLADPLSDDLVHRQFRPDRADRLWVQDVTQHRTGEGWVYLAVVIDAWSRRVVGWSIADHLRAELVVDALEISRLRRRPSGTIAHSDHGSQGGFNRSSQHLEEEVVDGQAGWVDDGADGAFTDEVARGAGASPRARAGVLETDRDGGHERGGSRGHWCVSGGRRPVVPPWWRDATDGTDHRNGPLLVVRRTRGDRAASRAGRRGEIDCWPDRPVAVDGVSRVTTQRCDSWRQARVSGIGRPMEGGPRRAATQDIQAR
jgi:hypothetical protein